MADKDLDRISRPDIEMNATIRATRLHFTRVPHVDVTFEGDTPREQVSGSERENLPDEVEAGVTYRDVWARWRAAARLRWSNRRQLDSD
jgi:hypothetical protein